MHVFIAGDSRWPRLWTWCERSWSFRTLGLLEIQDVGPGTLQRQVQPLRSYSALIWTLLQRPGHFYSALGISTLTALRAPWASQLKFQMSGNWRQWRWPESSRDSRVSITAKNTHHHECLSQRCGSSHTYISIYYGNFWYIYFLKTVCKQFFESHSYSGNKLTTGCRLSLPAQVAFASTPWLEGCGSAGTTTKQLQLLQYAVYGMGCRTFKIDFR